MSVMQCGRKGCECILCDRYSSIYGYICNDCFEELKESMIQPSIFMNTEKKLTSKYDKEFKKFHNELMEKEFPLA